MFKCVVSVDTQYIFNVNMSKLNFEDGFMIHVYRIHIKCMFNEKSYYGSV